MKAKIATFMLAVLVFSSALALMPDDSNADPIEVEVQCWTYSPMFGSTAENVQYYKWDFGDGTIIDSHDASSSDPDVVSAYVELLNQHGGDVSNPIHTYAAKGIYIVKQTVYNSFNGESSDSCQHVIQIMGHPQLVLKNGSETIRTIDVPKVLISDEYVPQTAERPSDDIIDGKTILGWYTDVDLTSLYDWNSPVTDGIHTIYAKVADEAPTIYSVTFYSGSEQLQQIRVYAGERFIMPLDPTRAGYDFAGWYRDSELTVPYQSGTPVNSNVNVYAKWTEKTTPVVEDDKVEITFSGTDVEKIVLNKDGTAQKPEDPVREGYTFAGWYTDEECTKEFDWSQPVTESTKLYAKWTDASSSSSEKKDEGFTIASAGFAALSLLGLFIVYLGFRSYRISLLIIGIAVAVFGGLSIYADFVGKEIVDMITEWW